MPERREITEFDVFPEYSCLEFICPECQSEIKTDVDELTDVFDVECVNCGMLFRCGLRLVAEWDSESVWKESVKRG